MKPSKEKDEIAAAEGTLVCHGVKRGHSFLSQQCLINVCKTIFTSSAVASNLSCARTKATAIAVYVTLKHIKLRWLSLYLSIKRLVEVFIPVKKYFLEQKNYPLEIKQLFERDEVPCILSFLQHILFEIHKKNLELQRYYTIAVDLFRIITSIKNKLKERIDSQLFCAACRYRLARLPIDKQNMLKTSFIEFLSTIISYIDSYFDQNIVFYRTINYFSYENIEALTWNQVIQCVDMLKIKGSNEDCLFDEFTNIKSMFKTISDQSIPIFHQVQAFVKKQNDMTVTNICDEVTDIDDNYSTGVKIISAELKVRLNSTLSCTELYKYILSSEDLLRAIKSDEKYKFKGKCV
ncbi:unnamed protein product [Rotaria sp. Silwood2]|nr:unnamed protein product [Rotaria sp. Silwood2]